MYHDDISKNYSSSTFPEFNQKITENSNDMSSTFDGRPSEASGADEIYNQVNASGGPNSAQFSNQYNNMSYNQYNPSQNFNYNDYNQDIYSQYQNQSQANIPTSSFSNFNQDLYNQGQFNSYQGQYNDQNFYAQHQNFPTNNYQGNFNNFHPRQTFTGNCQTSVNKEKPNFPQMYASGNQTFGNINANQQLHYHGYRDEDNDFDRRDRDMRDDRSRGGGRNDDWRNRRERGGVNNQFGDDRSGYNDSDQESNTSYDSDTGATKTVYINNIYQKWTEKDIENSIKKHGIVVKAVRIIPRKKAGSGRSFAFADFYKVSEAEKWMDATQSRLLFPDDTIAYLEYSEQCRNKAMSKRRDRGDEPRDRSREREHTPPKRGRDGDWSCDKCDFWNFKWRDNCFRCSNNKSETRSRSRSRSDDEDSQTSNNSRRKLRRLSEDDDRHKRDRSWEYDQHSLVPQQNLMNVRYPIENVGAELKYDYSNDTQPTSHLTNTSNPNIQKPKKTFKEVEMWETLTENDFEPPGGFKAPLPPIVNKKKTELGNRNDKLSIELKLKSDMVEKADPQQPTAELVASYGDSDSDEEDQGEDHLVDATKLVCLLCKRAFMNQQTLKKHQSQSQLHKDNLAEYKRKLTGSAILNTNQLKKL